jgi:Fe-Mn family superoxide dismutase
MSTGNKSRRSFLIQTIKASLGMTLLSKTDQLFGQSAQKLKGQKIMPEVFEQQPLPYTYDALEPAIDALTMEIHYTKHAATYCKNLNEACAAEKVDRAQSLENLLANISSYSAKLRNNAGGHYNHEMFWQSMRSSVSDNVPKGSLVENMKKNFGSFDLFKKQFSDAAKNRFGSGWTWLVKDTMGNLQIGSTPNQDNPLMNLADLSIKGKPLLGLDVWEHAYYLKYQNKRTDYIEQWWSLVNWDKVQERSEDN